MFDLSTSLNEKRRSWIKANEILKQTNKQKQNNKLHGGLLVAKWKTHILQCENMTLKDLDLNENMYIKVGMKLKNVTYLSLMFYQTYYSHAMYTKLDNEG